MEGEQWETRPIFLYYTISLPWNMFSVSVCVDCMKFFHVQNHWHDSTVVIRISCVYCQKSTRDMAECVSSTIPCFTVLVDTVLYELKVCRANPVSSSTIFPTAFALEGCVWAIIIIFNFVIILFVMADLSSVTSDVTTAIILGCLKNHTHVRWQA